MFLLSGWLACGGEPPLTSENHAEEVSALEADTTPPAVPQGLGATAGARQVTLTWTANTEPDLASYQVKFRVLGSTTWSYRSNLTSTTLVISPLAGGSTYEFLVKALDTTGNASAYSSAATATPTGSSDITPPAVPAGVSATTGSQQVTLTWSANTEPDLASYQVKFRPVGSTTWTYRSPTSATFFTVTGLTNGTAYEFAVRAVDTTGNGSVYSASVTATPTASVSTCPVFSAATVIASPNDPALPEASGLAASRRNANILWTHNDAGNPEHFFALNLLTAKRVATFVISGNDNGDWEDIAIGPGAQAGTGALYIGRIGDQSGQREIVRVPEPTVNANATPGTFPATGVERFRFNYPGATTYNAETLLVDLDGTVYVVTKSYQGTSKVFRYPPPLNASVIATLEFIADVAFNVASTVPNDRQATGGSISPAGDEIVIKTYNQTYLWKRQAGQSLGAALQGSRCELPTPGGSEAIAFSADGNRLYSLSEGQGSNLKYLQRQ